MNENVYQPGYFDLKGLAAYSSCSVRWLRDRLVDRMRPLPHHRVEGKILIKKDDFDLWMERHRTCQLSSSVDGIANDVINEIFSGVRA